MTEYDAEKYWSDFYTAWIDTKNGTYDLWKVFVIQDASTGIFSKGDAIVGRSLILKAFAE